MQPNSNTAGVPAQGQTVYDLRECRLSPASASGSLWKLAKFLQSRACDTAGEADRLVLDPCCYALLRISRHAMAMRNAAFRDFQWRQVSGAGNGMFAAVARPAWTWVVKWGSWIMKGDADRDLGWHRPQSQMWCQALGGQATCACGWSGWTALMYRAFGLRCGFFFEIYVVVCNAELADTETTIYRAPLAKYVRGVSCLSVGYDWFFSWTLCRQRACPVEGVRSIGSIV